MPREVREEIGRLYRRRKVKTFGDYIHDFFKGLLNFGIMLLVFGVLGALFG